MPTEARLRIVTPLGPLELLAGGGGLAAVIIHAGAGRPAATAGAAGGGDAESRLPSLAQAARALGEYFAGHRRVFELPLDLSRLPEFDRRVLAVLTTVPYGETITYGALAERAGAPCAARAVGQVMARNPLPIIIPCHRVVAAGGRPGGYSGGGGVETKKWLLAFERDCLLGKSAEFREKPLDSRPRHLLNRGPHFG